MMNGGQSLADRPIWLKIQPQASGRLHLWDQGYGVSINPLALFSNDYPNKMTRGMLEYFEAMFDVEYSIACITKIFN